MDSTALEKLKFPIGKFKWIEQVSGAEIESFTADLSNFPTQLENAVKDFGTEDFKKEYRPGGWQIGQLIHHLADSHIHCYVRFKHALTLDTPTILDYDQDDWAVMPDAIKTDVTSSLMILKGVHERWTHLIANLSTQQLQRKYYHPTRDKYYPLCTVLALYAWHGKHHLAHIENTP